MAPPLLQPRRPSRLTKRIPAFIIVALAIALLHVYAELRAARTQIRAYGSGMARPAALGKGSLSAATMTGEGAGVEDRDGDGDMDMDGEGEEGEDGDGDVGMGWRVAIVTFTTNEQSYTRLSLKNKHDYAKLHNYTLITDFDAKAPRGLMWHKLAMIERVIAAGKHDWIWWIDFDTLITNLTVRLEDIIDDGINDVHGKAMGGVGPQGGPQGDGKGDGVDFLFTRDCFPLNAGSMLARSSPGTLAFFSATRAYHDTHKDLSEQDCIAELINAAQKPELDTAESQQLQKQVRFVPQHRMNAFPEEIRCWEDGFKWSRDGKERRNGMWKRGDFAVHFAGAWAHVHENDPTGLLMRKYEMSVDGDVSEEGIW